MPLDPKIQKIVDLQKDMPAMHTLPVQKVRDAVEKQFVTGMPKPEVAKVGERVVEGPGGDLKLRIYTPEGKGPFPAIVFFHGSGFCICSLDTHDDMARHLCRGSGAVVVSVDYRLAPEHPYPGGPDDCLAATRWTADHALELNVDRKRIAVAGDSAGGNMAAVTALRVRDEGGPELIGQLLIYPVTDHYEPVKQSMRDNATGFGLMHDTMKWFWDNYLAGQSADDPRVSPLRAKSLKGLAPALVITAEYDVLLDEGEAYAKRLQADGVATRLTRYDGMNHGFLFWVDVVDGATKAMAECNAWLRERFAETREKAA